MCPERRLERPSCRDERRVTTSRYRSEFLDRSENVRRYALRTRVCDDRCAWRSAPGSLLRLSSDVCTHHRLPRAERCVWHLHYTAPTSPSLTFTSTHDTGVRVVARVIDEAANAHAPHRATLDLPDEQSKFGKSRRHQLDGDQASQRLLLVHLLDVLDKVPAPHTHYHKDGYTRMVTPSGYTRMVTQGWLHRVDQRHSAALSALSCTQRQIHTCDCP